MSRCFQTRCVLWTLAIYLLSSSHVVEPVVLTEDPFLFGIVSADFRDVDGDQDRFPDTGEAGRVVFTIRNGDRTLTGVTFVLTSSDPDVACVFEARVQAGSLTPGQTVIVGSQDPAEPGFGFRSSGSLSSVSGADPARIGLCLRLEANELYALSEPMCINLLADLDLPSGVTQTFIPGPDGVSGSADDGTVFESFDIDRDQDGLFTVNDTFLTMDAGTGRTEHGLYVRGTNASDLGFVPGVPCGGFQDPADGNTACALDPDFPMDWHLHCPPDALNCPNLETGTCVDGCSYATPQNGQKALSPPNSLHMGAHFNQFDSIDDTTHLRTLQAFVSGPLNLALFPSPGDLELSMFHIAALMDNNALTSSAFQSVDSVDVQVQVDRDPNPAVDDWGSWDKLAPFQNIYDHTTLAWDTFSPIYCEFTPGDTGEASPAPRGVHETMCIPQGVWSHCGSVRGTTRQTIANCDTPGVVDPSGTGVWAETRLSLAPHLGQRIRIRWIGRSWASDNSSSSYNDVGFCEPTGCSPHDDGWWLDDIRLTGALTTQHTPSPDTGPAPPYFCPAICADVDGDGYGTPGGALCPGGSTPDCDDLNAHVYPGAAELCNGLDEDCDGVVPVAESDYDHDGWRVCQQDCDDTDRNTFPLAVEVNDGRDNQCPGNPGFGVVDEISGDMVLSASICWARQSAATGYLLVRSTRSDFYSDCVSFATGARCVTDSGLPGMGTAFFYLVRAQAPYLGSWGQDSSGSERTGVCGF